jgi:transcriptional regulator with XRE-family HTH domain
VTRKDIHDALQHDPPTVLRTIRRSMGLTQHQFADHLGYHNKTISEMETGKLRITQAFAKKIATEFTLWQIRTALESQHIIELALTTPRRSETT